MKFKKNKTFIIAEIGINHDGSIKKAINLIKLAKSAGASAVKFQIFKSETMGIPGTKIIKMWKKLYFNFEQIKKLKLYSKKLKIYFISSVFDLDSLKIAKKLNLDAYKIASSEITNTMLLKEASKINKQFIISTGMANKKEIEQVFLILKKKSINLLHCVSLYPCKEKYANLKRINTLRKKFKINIGYSDHTIGVDACKIAITMGANIIEKHFSYNNKLKHGDHQISANYYEMKDLVNFSKKYYSYLGTGNLKPSLIERSFSKLYRKGVYANTNIAKGETLTKNKIILRRPESKTRINSINKILGKRAKKNIYFSKEILIEDFK